MDDVSDLEHILQNLRARPLMRFDEHLPDALPKTQGLYAISEIEGKVLHVGKTESGANGLWGRVWDQHYLTGGSSGDLVEKVKARGHARNSAEAREYIRQNCQVQWLEVECETLRHWAEHYLLARLRPEWCIHEEEKRLRTA